MLLRESSPYDLNIMRYLSMVIYAAPAVESNGRLVFRLDISRLDHFNVTFRLWCRWNSLEVPFFSFFCVYVN